MATSATSTTKRKRLASEADGAEGSSSSPSNEDDPIIGLDVGGKLFYTHRSTLTNSGSYFAARFGGMFSAGSSWTDGRGRNVYFLDADGILFEHILSYVRRGIPSWPD